MDIGYVTSLLSRPMLNELGFVRFEAMWVSSQSDTQLCNVSKGVLLPSEKTF
jgi:hypothetical protein